MVVNLSLYLVTDSTPAILGSRDLCHVVEEALKGGVTIVQYRDKTSDTGVLIEIAKKLHNITRKYNVPLIINDRVDVALASGAEGVHLGQDDMDIRAAKEILGNDKIIGISASCVEDAVKAVQEGADYLGIGTVFATPTKTNTKSIIGTAGVKTILDTLSRLDRQVATVAIGGINTTNVHRVIYQSAAPAKSLDGVAIVSAIVAAENPKAVAEKLNGLIATPPSFAMKPLAPRNNEVEALLADVPKVVQQVVTVHPLVHNMINYVVANFAANVALAAGISPIMSQYGDEAKDLSVHNGALVINMGTLTSSSISEYLKAISAYNSNGNPVVFDPVGAGATHIRRDAVKTLLAGGYFSLIKGNEREIKEVFQRSGGESQRGVDSGPSTISDNAKATLVRDLARRERNLVLLTGPVDYLSDGNRVITIANGHELLGRATGTGCAVGTITGAYLVASSSDDKLLAVLAGLLMYEIAAENAAADKDRVRGPGTFLPVFLDEIYAIWEKSSKGDHSWFTGRAKIQSINV
ncbi:putative thiamine-phosphate pyrophosphorylase [Talaromyces proteolyticus]|uniref:Thiamine-phosphate pyrophosphorylase n=1 Tax=Talaromyces proteolyticus TaxID=1131652 RepID=A0AAD4KMC1_9EURO|nr:putative thiamine-phosphate pyrophosphorylase [Talaromyces proteolyticus]KAH8696072.1 putative thiamine-phosphate pyrophosphorylase [Talaromyces proteolyticus]